MPKLSYLEKLKRNERKQLSKVKRQQKTATTKRIRQAKAEKKRQGYEFGVAVRKEVRKIDRGRVKPRRKSHKTLKKVWRRLI